VTETVRSVPGSTSGAAMPGTDRPCQLGSFRLHGGRGREVWNVCVLPAWRRSGQGRSDFMRQHDTCNMVSPRTEPSIILDQPGLFYPIQHADAHFRQDRVASCASKEASIRWCGNECWAALRGCFARCTADRWQQPVRESSFPARLAAETDANRTTLSQSCLTAGRLEQRLLKELYSCAMRSVTECTHGRVRGGEAMQLAKAAVSVSHKTRIFGCHCGSPPL